MLSHNIRSSHEALLDLRFDDAINSLNLEKKENPYNGFIALQENYIDFLNILINENLIFT